MGSNSLFEYNKILNQLKTYTNIPQDLITSFRHFSLLIYRSDQQNRFSEPMLWIGIYIALASLVCTLAMVADLVHGIRNRKLWFPCKYFTLNAASLSVIAVAVKLPMDLNNSMPGRMDLDAKIGSMAFMCTMMANLLPSLATMDNKELLTNIVALGVLVITLVVNVCIQINTGLLSLYKHQEKLYETTAEARDQSPYLYAYIHRFGIGATFYVGMLLMLLIIYACSSIAILKSKQILNSKYQEGHETTLKDLESAGSLTVDKLKQHVRNYWIMAGTSSPRFVTACAVTTSASGVICACSAAISFLMMHLTIGYLREYKSDYKWSMLVIFITQFIGALLGTIAPLFRCFADLSFNLSIKWTWNHINVFKVESYWSQKLCDWKHSSIPFSVSSRKRKIIIQNLVSIILSICIGFQKMVVVACKMIALIPIFFVICVLYCTRCWKWMKAMFSSGLIVLVNKPNQLDKFKDLRRFILTFQDDIELAERTLKGITKSVNRVIRKAQKQQPINLMKLLEKCSGFKGVGEYDSLHVTPEDHLNCWSLTLVTLTTVAVSLPDIPKKIIDRLLSSVSEGLVYVTFVEETFNASDDYVSIQKAAKSLWLEVEVYHKWLGNELRKLAPQVKTAKQILECFRDTAENMTSEVESLDICAISMHRTTRAIVLSYHTTIDEISQEELFSELSSMIADILAACLTNLPQVIAMKCHTDVIEKREESVRAAAQLLGETMQIINTLQDHQLPSLNTDELPFIDKWRAYLKHPFI
ncbi:hypothetical protein L1987_44195 [Smallanthus sonchifolius]|uniref:Uncharacterized protein n=1 Tax=Smallanthus sonchifolius TaxID=185202 RepID=A0ACB9GPI2_9ASTR|nr:hypothetical protein L1987_44195 [Smallanthus sonchifolius]